MEVHDKKMIKQTKKQAIKEAVKKCPFKKECKKEELTNKEKDYIIGELISATDSCNMSNTDLTINNFENAKFKDFEMNSKSEFELIKSILRKLKQGGDNSSQA